MQGYAGPVQQGDMVVRANEVSPGITALLSKQNRKGVQGIYELPSAKQQAPNYYNMALDNVQNEIRSAARMVNAMAPEGERLAYVNPEEEGILKLLGGAGEPQPVTGIPSYFRASQFSGPSSPGTSSSGGMRSSGASSQGSAFGGGAFRGGGGGGNNNKSNQEERNQILKDIDKAMKQKEAQEKAKAAYVMTGPANTQFQQNAAGLAAAIKEATGPAYADQAKGAITSFIGSAGSKDGKYDPIKAAQALVDISRSGTPEQQALAKQEYDALVDSLKYSLGSYDYGGKTLFGLGDGYTLGDETKNILRAAKTYGQLPRDKNLAEKAVDLFSNFSILSKLFGGGKKLEDMSIAELTEFYNKQDEMRRQEEERRRRSGRGDQPAPTEVVDETEEAEEKEEEFPYFSYYRRFRQPMTYEDIIRRAYEGSEGPLLETLQEAMDRDTE